MDQANIRKVTRRSLIAGAAGLLAMPKVSVSQTSPTTGILEFHSLPARLMGDRGPETTVWGYGSTWPPAVLHARQGEEFRLTIRNDLDREITLHWHGIRGPSDAMTVKIVPGPENELITTFVPPDAGTFWFGPIVDVARQREMGLYGLLIVSARGGDDFFEDLPLILDDWRISDAGVVDQSDFDSLQEAIGPGRLGNWFTANGRFRPEIKVSRGRITRIRMLNAANSRTMRILFKGANLMISALDGQPVTIRRMGNEPLLLAPGQRSDLLLPEGEEDVTVALDLFEDVVELAYLRREGKPGSTPLDDNFNFPANPISLPAKIGLPTEARLVVEGGAKGGLKAARYNDADLDIRALLEKGMAWAFNGVAGLGAEPWARFERGTTVNLTIENRTQFDQPLHIHGHVWKLREVAGTVLDDEPWRDTIIVPSLETARVTFVADNPGKWGLHSTLAERIDSGLFTSFVVAD